MYFTDLNLKASVSDLTKERCSLEINEFNFTESRSGLTVEDFRAKFWGDRQNVQLTNLWMRLPHSTITIPAISISNGFTRWLENNAVFHIRGEVMPSDLAPFDQRLQRFQQPIHLTLQGRKRAEGIRLQRLMLSGKGLSIEAKAEARLQASADSSASIKLASWHATLPHCYVRQAFYQPILESLSTMEPRPILPVSTAKMLSQIGDISLTSEASGSTTRQFITASVKAHTAIGDIEARGDL